MRYSIRDLITLLYDIDSSFDSTAVSAKCTVLLNGLAAKNVRDSGCLLCCIVLEH